MRFITRNILTTVLVYKGEVIAIAQESCFFSCFSDYSLLNCIEKMFSAFHFVYW